MSEASFKDLCGIREIRRSPSSFDISGMTGGLVVSPHRDSVTAF
jgi:hypothetical protein